MACRDGGDAAEEQRRESVKRIHGAQQAMARQERDAGEDEGAAGGARVVGKGSML